MLLEMYIDGKLVDSCLLSVHKIHDSQQREAYIQGATKALMEKWEKSIEDQKIKPELFVKGTFPFKWLTSFYVPGL